MIELAIVVFFYRRICITYALLSDKMNAKKKAPVQTPALSKDWQLTKH